jgi:5-methyltetrahydrofolate--homocysteine methyltransferase
VAAALASLYSAVPIEQENAFLAIGERANANGSKAFRELLLAEDWDGTVQLARSQTREGAHVLDVCVDYVGRDGVPDMIQIVDRYATQSTLPLVIDSTEAEVIEAALTRLGGRAVINSVNLEDGRIKADRLLPLAKRYGAAVIVLAIDEEGQARTADCKVAICERVARIAIDEFGLEAHDLIFDCLTFPLGSGQEDLRRDAAETLEAIERIKAAVPGCATTLGVSNVSFGLSPAARQVLNSVFLKEAMDRGLDSAIVHPGKILPLHRIPDEHVAVATDLIHDRRGTAGTPIARGPDGGAVPRDAGYDPLHELMRLFEGEREAGASKEELAALPVEERLERRIIDGDKDGIDADLDEALDAAPPAGHHQPLPARRHGHGRRAVRLRPDAAALRAAVGGDDEDRGRPPRTPHRGCRRGVLHQGPGPARDRQGRRPRHRQEPRRHHPAQQRLRRRQPRHQAADRHDHRRRRGARLRRDRHVRPAGQVDGHHEGEPRGAERPRAGVARYPVLLGGAALTRGYVEDDLRAIYTGEVFYCKDAFEGLRVLDAVMARRDAAAGHRAARPLTACGRRAGSGAPTAMATTSRAGTEVAQPALARRDAAGRPSPAR